jgi:hypothetical protein
MVVDLWVCSTPYHRFQFGLNAYFADVRFNDRWHTFTPSAAKGGQVAPMVEAV